MSWRYNRVDPTLICPSVIVRIMQVLTTSGVVKEPLIGSYQANSFSAGFCQPGLEAVVKFK